MDLAGLLGLLRRQWIIVSVIMLVAATSSFVTWNQATPSYRSTATLSVLPPRASPDGVARNPYLDIASAANADIAQRLSIQVNGTTWRERLTAEGHSPEYLIDHGDATSPILRIRVETDDPAVSTATVDAVITAIEDELGDQQERFDVNGPSRFSIDVLDRSRGARRVYGNRSRLTGAVLVLGGLAAVIAAQTLDNFQQQRRSRRRDEDEREPFSGRTEGQNRSENRGEKRGENGIWIPRPNVEEKTGGRPATPPPTTREAPKPPQRSDAGAAKPPTGGGQGPAPTVAPPQPKPKPEPPSVASESSADAKAPEALLASADPAVTGQIRAVKPPIPVRNDPLPNK